MTAPAITDRRSIAIVGAGIAGLTCAFLLDPHHDLTIFEAEDRLGGHANTVEIDLDEVAGSRRHRVDTGFIVFNDRNYPGFVRLLNRLGVAGRPSEMSFSVASERTGIEYRGTNPNTIFGQRRNLLRPTFLRMLVEIGRFNRLARRELLHSDDPRTLAEFVADHHFSPRFLDEFLVPLGASIWSADPQHFLDFPATTYAEFMDNHGLLKVRGAPRWRTIEGGSISYVTALRERVRATIRTATPVRRVVRNDGGGVEITTDAGVERFDMVILAAHSDQCLAMLGDPSPAETSILGAIAFQPNEAVLHTDATLLPDTERCRASWNYHVPAADSHRATLTYWMNSLQGLDSDHEICVSMNRSGEIDPSAIHGRFAYDHPVFDRAAVAAQGRRDEIQGVRDTFFAGAWWANGFHEDGVQSALDVCARFGIEL